MSGFGFGKPGSMGKPGSLEKNYRKSSHSSAENRLGDRQLDSKKSGFSADGRKLSQVEQLIIKQKHETSNLTHRGDNPNRQIGSGRQRLGEEGKPRVYRLILEQRHSFETKRGTKPKAVLRVVKGVTDITERFVRDVEDEMKHR